MAERGDWAPESEYEGTNRVVFTQNLQSGARKRFNDFYDNAVKYAEKNNKETPKKQDVFSKIMHAGIKSLFLEDLFKP